MKAHSLTISFVICISLTTAFATAKFEKNSMEQLFIKQTEIPANFTIGKIPKFASKLLKNNPWHLDHRAIKTLTGRIYPGGDYNSIDSIHMTIIAKKETPYSDDIVCYIILYKDMKSATNELDKLKSYVGYNSDRALLITRDNLAIFIHADDCRDFPVIQAMAVDIKQKLETL